MHFFTPIRNLLNEAIKLDLNEVLNSILIDETLQQQILDLNRQDQLFKQGIDSNSTKLSTIGGDYAEITKIIKRALGQPISRITLFFKGKFYESFFIQINPKSFDIEADTIKESGDLIVRWGKDILGLTEKSLEKLRQILLPLLLNEIRARLTIL